MPQEPCRSEPQPARARRSIALTVLGTAVVAGALAAALAGDRHEFADALQSAPLLILAAAAALQLLALVSRTEAWHASVGAAGGRMSRRCLFRASALGNLGSLVNTNLGAAGRIAVLRRTAPDDAPRVGALVTAEVPIVTVEALLAAITSFTLVGPLGLPWWLPLVLFAVVALLVTGLRTFAGQHTRGFWSGLAVLRSVRGRNRLLLFVLIAVGAQIGRNWMMLHAVGVDASLFDAIAVLITMVTLSAAAVRARRGRRGRRADPRRERRRRDRGGRRAADRDGHRGRARVRVLGGHRHPLAPSPGASAAPAAGRVRGGG